MLRRIDQLYDGLGASSSRHVDDLHRSIDRWPAARSLPRHRWRICSTILTFLATILLTFITHRSRCKTDPHPLIMRSVRLRTIVRSLLSPHDLQLTARIFFLHHRHSDCPSLLQQGTNWNADPGVVCLEPCYAISDIRPRPFCGPDNGAQWGS